MLKEGKACIITNYSGLKKEMDKQKMSKDKIQKIKKSILSISTDELRRIYKEK